MKQIEKFVLNLISNGATVSEVALQIREDKLLRFAERTWACIAHKGKQPYVQLTSKEWDDSVRIEDCREERLIALNSMSKLSPEEYDFAQNQKKKNLKLTVQKVQTICSKQTLITSMR